MARWDPDTRERLIGAALTLFTEHGYDNVTVAQIAELAGITRRSYFRYFPDKREVLFAGSERLPPAVGEAVVAAEATAPPLAAALEALSRVGSLLVERIEQVAERRAVIEASTELRERERTKLAEVTTAVCAALIRRGADRDTARLVAQLATVAFENAFARWVTARGERDFASCLHAVTASIRDAVTSAPDEHPGCQ